MTYQLIGKLVAAETDYRQAITFEPNFREGYRNLVTTLLLQGRIEEAVDCDLRVASLPTLELGKSARSLLLLNYQSGLSRAEVFAAHCAYPQPPLPVAMKRRVPDPIRPLRVGFISPDFRVHPVAFFLQAFFRQRERSQVHLYCYANNFIRDGLTEWFEQSALCVIEGETAAC